MTRLLDPDIRVALVESIRASGHIAVHEFTTHDARADVVAITDTDLVAYEIKSDADSHTRLARQVQSYDRVATRLYLVTTSKHLARMTDILPPWWGIIVASASETGVALAEVRDARENLSWEPLTAVQLLWHDELDVVMADLDIPLRSGKPKRVRAKRLATTVGESTRRVWLQALKRRYLNDPRLTEEGRSYLLRK